jgi:excisionase family DNA binding protein|nr:MAG TPA: helix-turn-helix domain protein [Caudoviricetes sp.]
MGKEKKWMTAKEYAETHGLPVSTIRRYCRAGEIPCLRIGQRFMFNPTDMDAFLEWKAREGLKDRPGTFLEAVKKAKEGTRISVWRARQNEEKAMETT